MQRKIRKIRQEKFGAVKQSGMHNMGFTTKLVFGFAMIILLMLLNGAISYYTYQVINKEIVSYKTGDDGSITIPAKASQKIMLRLESSKKMQLALLLISICLSLSLCMIITLSIKRPLVVMLDILTERVEEIKTNRGKSLSALGAIVDDLKSFILGKQ